MVASTLHAPADVWALVAASVFESGTRSRLLAVCSEAFDGVLIERLTCPLGRVCLVSAAHAATLRRLLLSKQPHVREPRSSVETELSRVSEAVVLSSVLQQFHMEELKAGLSRRSVVTGLNALQFEAWARAVGLRQNLFLTGGAGVGKSHVVRLVAESALGVSDGDESPVGVVAPTGAAAKVAKGDTLHCFFNIRARGAEDLSSAKTRRARALLETAATSALEEAAIESEDQDRPVAVLDSHTVARLQGLDLLVLDEVSMASKYLVELVDEAMRVARQSHRPFGGCAVLFCGDFFQLPPVLPNKADASEDWAFLAQPWKNLFPLQLTQVVRQQDEEFAAVLNRMRSGGVSCKDCKFLEERISANAASPSPQMAIVPYNKEAAYFNNRHIESLPSEELVFESQLIHVMARCRSNERLHNCWLRSIDQTEAGLGLQAVQNSNFKDGKLLLKVGCRVRCIRTVYQGAYPRRTREITKSDIGTVLAAQIIPNPVVRVCWDCSGQTTDVTPVLFSRRLRASPMAAADGEAQRALVYYQLPITVGFAITIHAAQGASIQRPVAVNPFYNRFDKMSACWQPLPGAAYVAMSRAASLSLMTLAADMPGRYRSDFKSKLRRHATSDADVAEYYASAFAS